MKVKFLPKKYIDVEVCPIYENRDAVIVQHTDTLLSNTCFNVEALGFKFGIKPTAFHWPYTGIQDGLAEIAKSGVMKFGVYIPTDRYRTNERGAYLPDYSATTLSSAGALYYGRTEGEAKASGFPNNGQELFDYTYGVKGYDVLNGVPGSEGNMDFIREMDFIDNWYKQHFGRLPSSGSDRQGKIGSKEVYLPYYIGMRSTATGSDHSYNAIDRLGFIHRPITSRSEYGFEAGKKETYWNAINNSINSAFTQKGMFNDFAHWHRAISIGNDIHLLHDLYEQIYNSVNGRNAWYAGYSEAVEYYWFKSMTKRVRAGLLKDGRILLVADFDDEYYNQTVAGLQMKLLYDRIKQPLSVKINLTGTIFDGKAIKTNYTKPLFLGNNEYIIDIPFRNGNYFKEVIISESEEENYKNFNTPAITVSGNNITSNIPVKVVLFSGQFMETMGVLERSNEFKTEHFLFNIADADYVGVVSETGISSLTKTIDAYMNKENI